jgi:hypothetical protein
LDNSICSCIIPADLLEISLTAAFGDDTFASIEFRRWCFYLKWILATTLLPQLDFDDDVFNLIGFRRWHCWLLLFTLFGFSEFAIANWGGLKIRGFVWMELPVA